MKAKVTLMLKFRSAKEALTVSSALKPDNLFVKENMRIIQHAKGDLLIVDVEVYGVNDAVGTLKNTVDEILAHIKSIEKVFEKLETV